MRRGKLCVSFLIAAVLAITLLLGCTSSEKDKQLEIASSKLAAVAHEAEKSSQAWNAASQKPFKAFLIEIPLVVE